MLAAVCVDGQKKPPEAAPQPAIRIPLDQLGYRGTPTAGLLETRASMMTLDFVDNTHVLFTYASRPLMTRGSEAPAPGAHMDRMVHAEIVELPDGKLVAEKDWRLHDRDPYLWPAGDGMFLLRVGGQMSIVGRELTPVKLMDTDSPIKWVQADKGCNLLVVEVEREQHSKEQHEKLMHDALLFNDPAPAEDYETYGLQLLTGKATMQELFHVHLLQPGALTGNEAWLLQVGHGAGGKFDVVALPLGKKGERHGEKHTVLRLKSDCRPSMEMLGHDVVMVSGCTSRGVVEYGVSLEGNTLWKRNADQPLWPDYERAANGRRFAVQRVTTRHSHGISEDEPNVGEAEVFDVATGERMFAVPLEPLYSTRHAVALTADGMQVALLRRGALEVYALPPIKQPVLLRAEAGGVPGSNGMAGGNTASAPVVSAAPAGGSPVGVAAGAKGAK